MKNSKLPLLLTLAFAALVIGVLLFLHFRIPVEEPPMPPASSAEQSGEPLPTPWSGDIITPIG